MILKKILVPIDFSPHSEKALQWALSLADREDTSIILFHVIPQPPDEWHSQAGPAEKKVEDELRAGVERQQKKTGTGKSARIETLAVWGGDPSSEICLLAKRQNVDLIVMGTHGRTGLSHILLGSVAEKVVHHAPCSVLTVRAPKGK